MIGPRDHRERVTPETGSPSSGPQTRRGPRVEFDDTVPPEDFEARAGRRADRRRDASPSLRARATSPVSLRASPARGLRLRRVPRRPGGDRRAGHRRRRRRRAHAHRWRQERHVPGARARARGHGPRGQPADRPHARPGRRAAWPTASARRISTRRRRPTSARRSSGRTRRRARPALRRARAAARPRHRGAAAARHAQRHRDRRGALRVAVGPRLPPRLPRARRPRRAVPRCAAHGAHRDRDARRRTRSSPSGSHLDDGEALRRELRPPQHPVPHRAEGRPAQAARRLHPRRSPRVGRHRLRAQPQVGRADGRLSRGAGRRRAAVPRGPPRRGARGEPVALPPRRRRRHGRDDRVRHGHRQARRALRRPHRPAEVGRGLLPGDRSCGSRRRAVGRLDGVRPRRRRAAAPHDRPEPRRPHLQDAPRPAPRRHARAVRDGRMPSAEPARLLRSGVAALRQLRHLPGRRRRPSTGSSPRRSCCRRSCG